MTDIEVGLPMEIAEAAGLAVNVPRGGSGQHLVSILLDGIDVAVTVTTLAAFTAQLPAVASAIRRWILRRAKPATLTVKGRVVDATIRLEPNVSVREISDAVARLLELERDGTDQRD